MEMDKSSQLPAMESQRGRKGLPRLFRMKRFWVGLLLAILLVLGIRTIFSFSRMEAEVSNSLSKAVTAQIQAWTGRYFSINPNDSFWKRDLNNIVRKAGHVIEYFLLGSLVCSFFHVLTRRLWPSICFSPLLCFLIGFADERLQYFSEGRGPRMSDVLLDTGAATVGILLTALVLALIRQYVRMSHKIKAYEQQHGKLPR